MSLTFVIIESTYACGHNSRNKESHDRLYINENINLIIYLLKCEWS